MTKRTDGKDVDYKLLNSTGERVSINRDANQSASEEEDFHSIGDVVEVDQITDVNNQQSFSLNQEIQLQSTVGFTQHSLSRFLGDHTEKSIQQFQSTVDTNNQSTFDITDLQSFNQSHGDLTEQSNQRAAIIDFDPEGNRFLESFTTYRSNRQRLTSESSSTTILSQQGSSDDTEAVTMTDPDKVDLQNLLVQTSSLAEDIYDFLDENAITYDEQSVQDIDDMIKKAEDLRSKYRSKHKELSMHYGGNYQDKFGEEYGEVISRIKEYIKECKNQRKAVRCDEGRLKEEQDQARTRKAKFLGEEVDRQMRDLMVLFEEDLMDLPDEIITRKKERFPEQLKELQNLSHSLQKIMEAGGRYPTERQEKYENLLKLKEVYTKSLDEEVKSRELEKQKNFKKSLLNIKIPKFKGYDSSIDIYTFQDNFEKLHLKDTPVSLLPDLLKNNYLENPARLLVKDLNDVDQIWRRLKRSYGDHKIMLSKKLAELSKIETITSKARDPSKTVESLSKMISLIKDLMMLAERHKIQNKLYYGDGLDRIYKLMGDARVTRWLGTLFRDNSDDDEDEIDEQERWKKLVIFLEKELKVAQEKSVIFTKTEETKPREPKDPRSRDSRHGYHALDGVRRDDSNTSQSSSPCFICGKKGHVQTNGPAGMKLVQYFVCKRFAEMKPEARFQFLKDKGYCTQCLFPGAEQTRGKHKDGNCQRDFICNNPSHSQSKKHVLLCEEHKESEENKKILQNFKERCIMRQRQQLPEYAKNINVHHCTPPMILTPDSNSNDYTSYATKASDDSTKDESAIYMLQTIKVNDHFFSLFYDSGCGDFVSRFDAIQRLGTCAIKECNGPTSLGGVGGISTKSPHGIYKVKLPLANGNDATLSGVCLDQITQTFPNYPLNGRVEEDIRVAYHESGGNLLKLPLLPTSVGGDTDFMFGIKYLRYFPEKIFQLPSGLAIYKSQFQNADGSFGVIGGPHKIFTEIEQQHHLCSSSFLTTQRNLFQLGYQVNPDISLLGYNQDVMSHDKHCNLDDQRSADGCFVKDLTLFLNFIYRQQI